MAGLLYWGLVAAMMAVISHIGTLLFAPGYAFEKKLESVTKLVPANQFFVLSPEAQAQIFPEHPASTVFGLCRFDLAQGDISLTANFPDTLWSLAVYTSAGKSIYTSNDEQAGTDAFSIKLMLAPGLLELFDTKTDVDAIANSGWRVSSSDAHGFALFWVPSFDHAIRAGLADTVSKSTCGKAT